MRDGVFAFHLLLIRRLVCNSFLLKSHPPMLPVLAHCSLPLSLVATSGAKSAIAFYRLVG